MRGPALPAKAVRTIAAGLALLGTSACEDRVGECLPSDLDALEPSVAAIVREKHATLAASPDDAEAWGALGMAYEANEFLDLALACYRRAGELAPGEVRWPYREGIVLDLRGDSEGALAAMERATRVDPGLARARWRLGRLRLERGELARALEDLERAVALDPGDLSGWTGLATARLQAEDPAAALEAAQSALEVEPRSRCARRLLGAALQRLGRTDEARPILAGCEGSAPAWIDPWDQEIRRLRAGSNARLTEARALVKSGRLVEAIELLEAIRRDSPEDLAARNQLALAYRDLGRTAMAREELESILEVQPDNPGARLNLAIVLAAQGRFGIALEEVDRALAVDPLSGGAREFRGVLLRELGRAEEAIEAFRSTLEVDQRNPKVRLWLAELLREEGNATAAELVLEPIAGQVSPEGSQDE